MSFQFALWTKLSGPHPVCLGTHAGENWTIRNHLHFFIQLLSRVYWVKLHSSISRFKLWNIMYNSYTTIKTPTRQKGSFGIKSKSTHENTCHMFMQNLARVLSEVLKFQIFIFSKSWLIRLHNFVISTARRIWERKQWGISIGNAWLCTHNEILLEKM